MASQEQEKGAHIYHGQVVGHGIGSTINMGPPTPTAPTANKPEKPMVTQHAEQYTSSYTAYPAGANCRPPAPYMRPQKPPPPPPQSYYGGGGGYWGEAAGAYDDGGYYGYRPPQPYGGGGYGLYYPPSEFGWGTGGGYGGGGYGGGRYGYGGGDGGGGYGGGRYGYGGGDGGGGYGGGHAYGRPSPHMSTGWVAAAGATAYGVYQHHMRKHHQGHGHGHGHGGDGGCSCGRGCSPGSCAAIHGEFEHEQHTKFKHSTAHRDVNKCGEHDAQAPHVTVLEKRTTTEVVQA